MKRRFDLTASWQMIVQQAAMFACQHGIAHDITEVCLLADDKAKDVTRTVEERPRGAFFIPAFDQLIMRLNERFGKEQMGF
jgi:hypothetical protein